MSTLLRTPVLSSHAPAGIPAVPDTAVSVYDQLLGSLASTQSTPSRVHLVGVAGCRPGDGATHVAGTLAALAARQGKRVLYAEAAPLLEVLAVPSADLAELCTPAGEPRLWHLPSARRVSGTLLPEPLTLTSRLAEMRAVVDTVVLDMGAVTTAGQGMRLCSSLDDLLLVVAAGETRRAQIAYAQRVLAHAGGTLTGCVLNKRTYPLPSALFRALN